jgi:colanic acid/amylovoran biosynthesis glycosyltransferase
MRVAFFLTDPFPVVSETFILNQITGLIDRGHDVRIFARRPAAAPVHGDVDRYGLPGRTTYWPELGRGRPGRALRGAALLARHAASLPVLIRVLDVARFGRTASSLNLLGWASRFAPASAFDVVCCHFGWNGRYAAMLRDTGVLCGRLVTFFHGADVSLRAETAPGTYARLFECGDLFLPISEHWRAKLIALGCPAARTHVHRMGIDCGRFALRERRLAPGEPVRLVGVSRLVEKKGVAYGIRAVHRLAGRGRDVRYEIIGDGPLRGDIERLVAELGVGDRVTLRGWLEQDEVLRAYERSHIAIAPSVTGADGDQEGIPVALMEAMAAGMPVVSTLHSGIPELIEDGVSGRLVPERDVEALAGALEQLIDAPERWPEMGRAGRRRVEQAFDIGALNDRLVERFEGLLADA